MRHFQLSRYPNRSCYPWNGRAFSLLRKPVQADELATRLAAVLDQAKQTPAPESGTKWDVPL